MLLLCSRRHIGRRFWFPGEVWVVPPVGVVGIAVWGCGWWLVLAHCIGLFSQKITLLKEAMLSLVLSGLTVEAWLVRHRCLSHCSYLMLIPHFKLFQPPS